MWTENTKWDDGTKTKQMKNKINIIDLHVTKLTINKRSWFIKLALKNKIHLRQKYPEKFKIWIWMFHKLETILYYSTLF